MSRIKIKNFGPIKEGFKDKDGNEWMDIKKVTVFIGNQGSGKSTVAKVISTLTWVEKALNRGDFDVFHLTKADFYELFHYQRIRNYFKENTIIEYQGERASVKFNEGLPHPEIKLIENSNYEMPQIMYVPAERNFLSVVKNAYGIKNLPDTLYTFAEELRKGQMSLNDRSLELPIGNIRFKYKKENDTSTLIGKDFELDLTESSSGYQSLVPLYLVTKFLSDELGKGENILREQLNVEQSLRRSREISAILSNSNFSEDEKNEKIKEINKKYLNVCLINIVEEPEQNLFPTSQQKMLNSLLMYNNLREGNKLIMTTHSPYLINYLTLSVEAGSLKEKIRSDDVRDKVQRIVPLNSTINSDDLVIYELDERNGTIKLLESYEGLPSDENKLNEELGEGNESFAKLLEIEQKL